MQKQKSFEMELYRFPGDMVKKCPEEKKNFVIYFLLQMCFQGEESKIQHFLKLFCYHNFLTIEDMIDFECFHNQFQTRQERLQLTNEEMLSMPPCPAGFEKVHLIGEGAFGKVFRVKHCLDEQQYALKQIRIQKNNEDTVKSFMEEMKILSQCQHRNIVRYHCSFLEGAHLFLQMEICDFNLASAIASNFIPLPQKIRIMYECLNGIDYLHRRDFIHFDLKPDNILLKRKTVKIADFGFTMLKQNCMDNSNIGCNIYSPTYLENATIFVDIYALGVIFIELLGPRFKTDMEKILTIKKRIRDQKFDILQGKSRYQRYVEYYMPMFFNESTTTTDLLRIFSPFFA